MGEGSLGAIARASWRGDLLKFEIPHGIMGHRAQTISLPTEVAEEFRAIVPEYEQLEIKVLIIFGRESRRRVGIMFSLSVLVGQR